MIANNRYLTPATKSLLESWFERFEGKPFDRDSKELVCVNQNAQRIAWYIKFDTDCLIVRPDLQCQQTGFLEQMKQNYSYSIVSSTGAYKFFPL